MSKRRLPVISILSMIMTEHFMMKYVPYTVFALLFLSAVSCMPPPPPVPDQALLVRLQSPNCTLVDGFLNYENDSIQVAYVFWAENGLVGVYVHNKLKQPLYVDWKKCSFITGTTKHDYWDETVTVTTNGSSAGSSEISSEYWKTFYSGTAGYSLTTSNTIWSAVTTVAKPERITFIPPGTTISHTFNSISQNPIDHLDKAQLLSKDTTFNNTPTHVIRYEKYKGTTYRFDSVDTGPLTVHMLSNQYVIENSPLTFRIFMTYSLSDKFTSEAFIDNQFYVDQITQIPRSSFDTKSAPDVNRNVWATPNSFYVFKLADAVTP